MMISVSAVAPRMVDSVNQRVRLSTTNAELEVAVVKPVFTATAYSSYYSFYSKYHDTTIGKNITSDLGLLNTTLVDGWGWSNALGQFFNSQSARDYGLVMGQNVTILTDVNVTQGALFDSSGSDRFDVVVLGFTEYVTAQQYYEYKHFVADGGRLILMDATNFLAEVRYYPSTNHLALVRGHGWGFDGKKVWRDVLDRWRGENAIWVASTFCCYALRYDGATVTGNYPISLLMRQKFGERVFTSYKGHEENQVTNMTGTLILARWVQLTPNQQTVVAAYLHRYVAGTVIHIGVMSSDVISSDKSVQFFLVSSILDAAVGAPRS